MRIAIVGGGIHGLSSAWALARLGHEVVLFEQHEIGNDAAASADEHRLIRTFYPGETGYQAMARAAFDAWVDLWMDLGERYYVPCGALALCREEGDWTDRARLTAAGLDSATETLPLDEIRRRNHALSTDGVRYGLWSPWGGVLLARRILAALHGHLIARGVRLQEQTAVSAIDTLAGELTLADGRRHQADLIIAAAGGWLPGLVPDFAPSGLQSKRQTLVYAEAPGGYTKAWENSPAIIDLGGERGGYAVPPVAGTGLKFAVPDLARPVAGPQAALAPAAAEMVANVMSAFAGWLNDGTQYRVVSARGCCYTMAPEERLHLRFAGRCLMVAACSGHGFKFGPLLGQAIAECAGGGLAPADLERWAAGRR